MKEDVKEMDGKKKVVAKKVKELEKNKDTKKD